MNTDALTKVKVKKKHVVKNIYAFTEKRRLQKIARNQAKCATRQFINKFEIDLAGEIKEQLTELINRLGELLSMIILA